MSREIFRFNNPVAKWIFVGSMVLLAISYIMWALLI